VWPLLLWLAWQKKISLLVLAIVGAAASFALNIYEIHSDIIATFYSPATRFWELLSGSILAWVTLYKRDTLDLVKHNAGPRILANTCSSLGLFLLAYGICVITKDFSFPGVWALLPVGGALLLISAGPKGWFNRTILSHRLMVWFGFISFPLYLWHWPLLSFAKIIEGETPNASLSVAAVSLAVLLAWLTYRIVELPIRFGITYSRAKTTLLVALMLVVGCVGYLTYRMDGLSSRNPMFQKLYAASGEWGYPGSLKPTPFKDRIFYSQQSEKQETTLFIGDSNIEQYAVRMQELIKTKPRDTDSVVFATGGGCLPIPASPYDESHKYCMGLMDAAFAFASENTHIQNVVIGAQWNQYLSDGTALVGPFGYGSALYESSLSNLSAYIDKIKQSGKKVFLVTCPP